MPELPEVETMVRGLRPALEGRVIRNLKVVDPHLLANCDAPALERKAKGARVSAVNRRGKWVVIELDAPRGIIVIQPRMTGAFYLVDSELARHIRLTLTMTEPEPFAKVHYNDPRRLGRISWYPDPEAAEVAFSKSHGPDALVITADDLANRLARTTRPIKPTLIDQKVLAGIGNIYADEILHRSRVHPERPSNTLDRPAIDRIHWRYRRGAGRRDQGGRLQLRPGLSDGAWSRRGLPCHQSCLWPGGQTLQDLRDTDHPCPDHWTHRPIHAFLPDLSANSRGPRANREEASCQIGRWAIKRVETIPIRSETRQRAPGRFDCSIRE